ncbi:MAG: DegV family protein [Lachnospiraceae bacterium]
MKKIAVVTDSNSSMSPEEAKSIGVFFVSMPFFIDGELFFEGKDLTQERFYERLKNDVHISTSQPSPGDITDLWDEILKEYDEIVHIPMSSALSSSYQTASMLAQDYDGKIFVVNNKRISVTQRHSVLDALAMIEKGYDGAKIKEILEKEGLESSIYIALETLKYLKKGGRITPAAAMLGTVLNLKPVLQIQGGKLDSYAKARGMKQAERIVIEAIKKDLQGRFCGQEVFIDAVYSGSEEHGKMWKQKMQKAFPEYDIHLAPLSLSVACHIGDGAIAATCVRVIDERK